MGRSISGWRRVGVHRHRNGGRNPISRGPSDAATRRLRRRTSIHRSPYACSRGRRPRLMERHEPPRLREQGFRDRHAPAGACTEILPIGTRYGPTGPGPAGKRTWPVPRPISSYRHHRVGCPLIGAAKAALRRFQERLDDHVLMTRQGSQRADPAAALRLAEPDAIDVASTVRDTA